jgi:hypothetical protein
LRTVVIACVLSSTVVELPRAFVDRQATYAGDSRPSAKPKNRTLALGKNGMLA